MTLGKHDRGLQVLNEPLKVVPEDGIRNNSCKLQGS